MLIIYAESVAIALALTLTGAQAGTVHCNLDLTQGGWDKTWDQITTAVIQYCETRVPKGGSGRGDYFGGAIQLETSLKPGVSDSHCGQAFSDILGRCFDSSSLGRQSAIAGSWTSNSKNDEWHWLWVDPSKWHNDAGGP